MNIDGLRDAFLTGGFRQPDFSKPADLSMFKSLFQGNTSALPLTYPMLPGAAPSNGNGPDTGGGGGAGGGSGGGGNGGGGGGGNANGVPAWARNNNPTAAQLVRQLSMNVGRQMRPGARVGAVRQAPAGVNQGPQMLTDMSNYGETGGEGTFYTGAIGGGNVPLYASPPNIGYARSWNPFNLPPYPTHVDYTGSHDKPNAG